MTLFVGGPYDGRDLPLEPIEEVLWLPAEDDLDVFLEDTKLTADITWVSRYRLDTSVAPPVYRYAMELGTISLNPQERLKKPR